MEATDDQPLADEELDELFFEIDGGGEIQSWRAYARAAIAADCARWGRSAPPPADREVGLLPTIVSQTGREDEPEIERIICSAISGGADYRHDMPRELSLKRITPNGVFEARYLQGSPEVAPPSAGEGATIQFIRRVMAQMEEILLMAAARWGRPAARSAARWKPLPVSVLPWECKGWCDKDGRCWFGWAAAPSLRLDASWSFCKPSERGAATQSLPAHALPMPLPTTAELEGTNA